MDSPGPSVPPVGAPANHPLIPTAPRLHPGAGNPGAKAGRAATGGLDMAGLLRAFGRRWMLAVVLGLLLGGVAFAAVWFFLPPPTGTAYSQLHVDQTPTKLVFDLGQHRQGS